MSYSASFKATTSYNLQMITGSFFNITIVSGSGPSSGNGGFGTNYSISIYQPRYALPTGVSINPSTGISTGYPVGMTGIVDLSSTNVVTLTDQGSTSANYTALQNAINATVNGAVGTETTIILPVVTTDWGDEISIPSATWGGKGLVIRAASIPRAAGERIQASDVTSMPKFVLRPSNVWSAPGYGGDISYRTCIRPQNNASNWSIVGINFTVDSTHARMTESVLTNVDFLSGVGLIFTAGDTAATFCDKITIDRCAFTGLPDKSLRRGLHLNGSRVTVVNSRFTDWHYQYNDSQCYVNGSGGSGHIVENNYFASAYGENVLFGGVIGQYDTNGDPVLSNIQSNIVVRRNYFHFPASYVTAGYKHKNLFESKGGRVALFEGNIGDGYRLDNGILGGQYFAFVFKYSTNAGYQWCARLNKIINSNGGPFLNEGLSNMELMHNLYDRTGVVDHINSRAWTVQTSDIYIASGTKTPDGYTMRYNTFDENCTLSGGAGKVYENWFKDLINPSTPRLNWLIDSNVALQANAVDDSVNSPYYFTAGYYDGTGIGTNASASWASLSTPNSTFGNNVISGVITAQQNRKIGNDTLVQRKSDVLLDASLVPQSGSPALGKGCDIALLNKAILRVDTGLLNVGSYASTAYAPTFIRPTQVQYNTFTGKHELISSYVQSIAYNTNLPSSSIVIADSGSISVNNTNLINALTLAFSGSGPRRIILKSGVNYGQNINLDMVNQAGANAWVYLETEAITNGTFRQEGQRVGLDDTGSMPMFGLTNYNVPAIALGPNTRRLRLTGLKFCTDPASLNSLRSGSYGQPGNGTAFTFTNYGFVGFSGVVYPPDFPTSPSYRPVGTPTDVIIDRCVLQGDDYIRYRRLIYANINNFVLRDSYLECAGDKNAADSQCVTITTCAGPQTIINNTIACANGENIAFGGGGTGGSQYIPKNIVTMNNHLTFLDRWGPNGLNYFHKNMYEHKIGQYILFEGNIISNYYGYGRLGNQFQSVVIKTTDQGSNEDFVTTSDVTIRLNKFVNSSGFVNIIATNSISGSAAYKATHNVEVSHNASMPWSQSALGVGYTAPTSLTVGSTGSYLGDSERFLLTDLVFKHNTLWGADQAGTQLYQRFIQIVGSHIADPLTRWNLSNNLMTGPNPEFGWSILPSNDVQGARVLPTGWTELPLPGTTATYNHIQGYNQSTLDTSIGSTNKAYASGAQLVLDPTTLYPNVGSPVIGVSSTGINVGVDNVLLENAVANTLTGRVGKYASSTYTTTYNIPKQIQYNTVTGLHELKSTYSSSILYNTNLPTSSIVINDTGTTSGNEIALRNAYVAAFAGTGPRRIVLKNNVNYGQNHIIDMKNLAGPTAWVYIEGESVFSGTLRPEGQRVGLDDTGSMPYFGLTTYNQPAFDLQPSGSRLRLTGLYFRTDPTVFQSVASGAYGLSGGSTWQYHGMIGFDTTVYPPNNGTPYRASGSFTDIIIDRCVLKGDDEIRYRRALLANFDKFVLKDSYIECAGDPNQSDSQGIAVTSTAGDHIIINNYIASAWGEHCIYGGGGSAGFEYVTKDIVWMGNHHDFLDRWGPTQQNRLHKNMFEIKFGRNLMFEGNIISNYYGYGRLGGQNFAIVLKATDQGSGEEFVVGDNLTVRLNQLEKCSGAFVYVPGDRISGSGLFKSLNRCEISHNIMLPWNNAVLGLGSIAPVQFGLGVSGSYAGDPYRFTLTDVVFKHNSMWGAVDSAYNRGAQFLGESYIGPPELVNFNVSDNLWAEVDPYVTWFWLVTYPGSSNGMPTGWNNLIKTNVVTTGNYFSGVTDQATQVTQPLGPSNIGVVSFSNLGIDPTTLALNSNSLGKGISSNGSDPGVDQVLLATAIARSRTGRG